MKVGVSVAVSVLTIREADVARLRPVTAFTYTLKLALSRLLESEVLVAVTVMVAWWPSP